MPNSMWNGMYGDAEKQRRNDYDRSGRTISDVSARAVRRRGGGEVGNRAGDQSKPGTKGYLLERAHEQQRGVRPSNAKSGKLDSND